MADSKINNIVLTTVANTRALLSKSEKRRYNALILLTVVGGIVDVFGLASVIPLVGIMADPGLVESNGPLSYLYGLFGFGSTNQFIVFILVCVVLLFLAKNVLILFVQYYQSKFSYDVANNLTENQLLYYLNINELDKKDQNLNSSIVAHNIAVVPAIFSLKVLLNLITFFSEIVIIGLICTSIAIYNYQVFILVIVSISPIFILLYRSVRSKIQKIEKLTNKISPDVINDTLEAVRGVKDVILYQKIDFFSLKILKNQRRLNRMKVLTYTYGQSFPKIIELAAILGIVTLSLASMYLEDNALLLTTLSIYIVATYRIMPSSNKLMQGIIAMKSFSFVFDILQSDKKSFGESYDVDNKSIAFNDSIELEDIHFKYDDTSKWVLNGVSLNITKGGVIGIMGESGAGKTSLINILLRFNTESQGRIKVDGQPINKEHLQSWRKLIGYVQQNVFLIDGTVSQNIAFGIFESKIDTNRLDRAIEMAGLTETINNMENGINSMIGEHGTKLSGGQRQRIAIARALYKGAEILIFDEATNALDIETERGINESISQLNKEGVTVIVVSHRESALEICESIYKLKDGRFT